MRALPLLDDIDGELRDHRRPARPQLPTLGGLPDPHGPIGEASTCDVQRLAGGHDVDQACRSLARDASNAAARAPPVVSFASSLPSSSYDVTSAFAAARTAAVSRESSALTTAGPLVADLTRMLSVHTSRTCAYCARGPRGLRQSSVALPRATARSSTFMDASVRSSSSSLSRVSWSGPMNSLAFLARLPSWMSRRKLPPSSASAAGGRNANAAEERSATRREEDAT